MYLLLNIKMENKKLKNNLKNEIVFNNSVLLYILNNKKLLEEFDSFITKKDIIKKDKYKKIYDFLCLIKKNILKENQQKEIYNKKLRSISILSIFIMFLTIKEVKKLKKNLKKSYNKQFNLIREQIISQDLLYQNNFIIEEEIFDIFLLWQYHTWMLNKYIKDILQEFLIIKQMKKKVGYNYKNDEIQRNIDNKFNIIVIWYKDYVIPDFNKNILELFIFFENNLDKIITKDIIKKLENLNKDEEEIQQITKKINNTLFFTTKNQIFPFINKNIYKNILFNLYNIIIEKQKQFSFDIKNEKDFILLYNNLFDEILSCIKV